MDETPYVANDREVTQSESAYVLETGIIGHENVEQAYSIGTNGGPILAFVQLLRGRDITQPLKTDRMQGIEIVARVRSGLSSLPPKGTEVLIAFPGGMSTKQGAGVVVAELSRVDQTATYGNMVEGELCLHPGTADAKSRILMKKNNTISAFTIDADGQSMAIIVDASTGNITMLSKHGAINLSSSGLQFIAGNAGIQIGSDGKVAINCTELVVNGKKFTANTGTVLLGATATITPANAAVHGPTGMSGVGSASVFIGV